MDRRWFMAISRWPNLFSLVYYYYSFILMHSNTHLAHSATCTYLGRMLHMHYHHRTCKPFELWRDFYCSGCDLIALGFLMGVLRCTYMSSRSADTVLNDIILFISV